MLVKNQINNCSECEIEPDFEVKKLDEHKDFTEEDTSLGGHEEAEEEVPDFDEHILSEGSTGNEKEVLKDMEYEAPATLHTKEIVVAGEGSTEVAALQSEPKVNQKELKDTDDNDGLNVEMEPDENVQVVGQLDAVVPEEHRELLDIVAQNMGFLSSVVGAVNNVESNDTVNHNTASNLSDKEEEFRKFLQWTQSLWSRLNRAKKKMTCLIETKVRDLNAKSTEVLQDVVKNEANVNVEGRCDAEVAPEVREYFNEVNDRKEDYERKYDEAEETKEVMGMYDSHIVPDYVY